MNGKAKQIYKCMVCDTVVEILDKWGLDLVCCGRSMVPLRAKTADANRQEHTLFIEHGPAGVRVRMGQAPHPMTAEHYIEWIDLIADGRFYRQFLQPGQAPEACFAVRAERVTARAYCSRNGLWRSSEGEYVSTSDSACARASA